MCRGLNRRTFFLSAVTGITSFGAGCSAVEDVNTDAGDTDEPGDEDYSYTAPDFYSAAAQAIDPWHWDQPRTIFTDPSGGIHWESRDGTITEVANRDGGFERVCWSPEREHTVLIDGETAEWYLSVTDVADDPFQTEEDVRRPINEITPYWNREADSDESEDGLIWAEYHVEEDRDHIVWKTKHASNGSPRFDDVLRIDAAEFRHFHSLDHDPYNLGHIWVTAGDGDGECKWYESTDHGETWEELSKPDTAIYQTLRLNFTKDHVYWPMDRGAHNPDVDAYMVLRADRDALDDPEVIAEIDTEGGLLSYGSVYIDSPRPGILVTTRGVMAWDGEEIPLHFYDLQRETFQEIGRLPVESTEENRPGVVRTLPYQNANGTVSLAVEGAPTLSTTVPNRRDINFLEPQWITLNIDHLIYPD